ncbi:hypothetical protein ROZALSC1DRAFT_31118 [Rozella allomycis CSF55]|uniref:Uncharacterized protein n=1 Tax=Rozella allomycis (strain CSF55) TaxID=988480 RepID=A0A4P9YD51_ROZAC|nr:hypothetical protein ROZALSC1DRAFT_31118 [Rozella allomycis CSF55]
MRTRQPLISETLYEQVTQYLYYNKFLRHGFSIRQIDRDSGDQEGTEQIYEFRSPIVYRNRQLASVILQDRLEQQCLSNSSQMKDVSSSNPVLDMRITEFDGDDTTTYCTVKNKNANILFKHNIYCENAKKPASFVLTEIVIKAPAIGYTCPIKDGLIFVSNEPIDIDATCEFDGFTEEKYRMFMKSQLGKRWVGKHTPALYFKVDQKEPVYVRQLRTPRSGSYILVKLLSSHGKGGNIDIQYIGFKGYYGKKSFDAGQTL